MSTRTARRYLISGTVHGAGFRFFVERAARAIGVAGWACNLDDGNVEVHASGTTRQLDDLEARLRQGPPGAAVRSVEAKEAAMLELKGFHIRYR